jgi:hypothetical protein
MLIGDIVFYIISLLNPTETAVDEAETATMEVRKISKTRGGRIFLYTKTPIVM